MSECMCELCKGEDCHYSAYRHRENGPWRVYKRGYVYRVGRRRWWGRQWYREMRRGDEWVFETPSADQAKGQAQENNRDFNKAEQYRRDRWHEA